MFTFVTNVHFHYFPDVSRPEFRWRPDHRHNPDSGLFFNARGKRENLYPQTQVVVAIKNSLLKVANAWLQSTSFAP
jgi:hypothetical protein